MLLTYLPSPSQGVWHLGPVPIRGYALCIIAGIVAAVWIGERRWVARGGRPGTVMDVSVWAVLFGLVGGRLYHVLTDPELYFGAGQKPLDTLKVWQGGLGIWGAVVLGGVGAWLACRRRGIRLAPFADALAPAIAVAQAIGRWGNWFNQELFGRPTTLPWGLRIEPGREGTVPGVEAYHPTFLYESLWDLGVAGLVVLADRRFRLGRGRAFALYAMAYAAGRFWIEALRIDPTHHFLGLRLNDWTSILVFAAALAFFLLRRGPRETEVEPTAEPASAEGAPKPAPGEGAEPEPASAESAVAGRAAEERAAEERVGEGAAGAEPADQPVGEPAWSNGTRTGDTSADAPARSGASGPNRPPADVPSDHEQ